MTAAVGGVVEGRKTFLAMEDDVDDNEEVVCAVCVGVLLLMLVTIYHVHGVTVVVAS